MSKIIQISTVPTRAETYRNSDGNTVTRTEHRIFALTEDGKIWCRSSDDSESEPWSVAKWPEPKDGDK